LISGSVLLLGFFFLGPIYQFKNENEGVVDNGLKVMTFNVRGFNQMGQLDNSDINNLILNFIETENPDIVCMQEAPHFLKNPKKGHLKKYNHKFIDFIYGREQNRSILSVHSKYPILNKYQTIKGDMSDSFFEKGEGFGKTYRLFRYPMRIDYILADDSFKISDHKNYDERLSDHYPVMATLQLKAKQ